MMVGVGSFSSNDNAVQGTGGTDLPSGTGIAVNLSGQYFVGGSMIGYGTTIAAGSNAAKGFILLHELAHVTGAAGFLPDDSAPDRQASNNQTLLDECGKMINGLGVIVRPNGQFRR